MFPLLILHETKKQVVLEMYAEYSVQLPEAPAQEKDVNTFIPALLHKQTQPMEASQWEGFLLLTLLKVSYQTGLGT